jgi:hypothetical protein
MGEGVKGLLIAVDRDDAKEVSAGDTKGVATLPGGHFDGSERGKPGNFRRHIVRFDVDVVADGGLDGLDSDNEIRDAVFQGVELRLPGRTLDRRSERSGPEGRTCCGLVGRGIDQ